MDMRARLPVTWTRRSILGFVATTLATAALLLLLLVRLAAAGSATNAASGSPIVGHPAPAFTISLWNGQPGQKLALASLKGKAVVLTFWASWCDSCTEESSLLEKTAQQYAPQGVVFVGIAYGDDQSAGVAWLQQQGVTYPSGPDADGSIAIAYGLTGVPETVFIGRDDIVNSKFGGLLDDGTLNRSIEVLLKR
jgi:cytochrome c biogenesis protein CcmG, thiol:disulfide interchange protein DsbE